MTFYTDIEKCRARRVGQCRQGLHDSGQLIRLIFYLIFWISIRVVRVITGIVFIVCRGQVGVDGLCFLLQWSRVLSWQ